MSMQEKRKKQDIESIGPLSPQQEGLLFHALSDPARDPYFCQSCLRLEGPLDVASFESAWFDAVARHAALRTDFKWEKLDRPVQIVFKPRRPCLDVQDWREQGSDGQQLALQHLLALEHAEGFDFGRAGDLRIKLIRIGADMHWLVWSYHHVSMDGWSFAAVLKDVMAAYLIRAGKAQGLSVAGGDTVLAPARPYRDYIEWLAMQDAGAAKAYWAERLSGMEQPAMLDLGAAETLIAQSQATHAEQHLHLSPPEVERVQAFARSQGVTLGTLYQGLWALLLSRCGATAGANEVVFGLTVSGRPVDLDGTQDMVGLFINTVPLRVSVDDAQPVSAWLAGLQAAVGAMRAHEHLPLAMIQAVVQASAAAASHVSDSSEGRPERDGVRRGLFDSLVVIENFPVDEALLDARATLRAATQETGRWVDDVLLTQGRNNYPLTLIVVPGVATQLVLAYDRRRFADAAVRRLLNHMRTALHGLCTDAHRPLCEIRLLDEAAWRQAHAHAAPGFGLHDAAASATTPLPVHALIEALAHSQPHRVAAREGEQVLSRSELNRKAEALAARLRHAGVQTGSRVALLMPRGLDIVVAMLGVLKTGAVFVPLDWRQPAARLSCLLADSQVACVLAGEDQVSELKPRIQTAMACPWVLVHEPDRSAQGAESDHRAMPVSQRLPAHSDQRALDAQPAYMIYTSGSTGEPKGVVVSHGALRCYAQAVMARLSLPDDASMAWLSTPAADLGYTSLFGALCSGRPLHVIDEETARDPQAFSDQVAMHGIDAVKLTPSHLSGLMHAPRLTLPRHVVLGGEPLPTSLAMRIAQLAPGTRIFNHYGPTETTVGVIAGDVAPPAGTCVDAPVQGQDRALPLGWPLDHAEVWVLDCAMQPAPVGAPGELFIGGAGVAQGYWSRPGLSADRFVPNPFADSGSRLYRTGDRGRRLGDGRIEFLGRRDSQVKIRGYRVEPEETASWLRAQPGVASAVVIARAAAGEAGHRLMAYVVAEPVVGCRPDPMALRTAALNELPEAFVPAHIVLLERLPLTANGKVDHRALPDVASPQLACVQAGDAAPRNAVEEALVSIWRAVLKQERIGIHDNFFDLGGDSILNLQIIGRARKQGIRLTPKQVFEHQTIAALATVAVTSQEGGSSVGASAPVTVLNQGADALPLTPIQQWFFDRPHAQPAHWNQAIVLEVARTLDAGLLRSALLALLQRHDALRLRFYPTPHGWRQTVSALAAGQPGDDALLAVWPTGAGQPPAQSVQALHQGLDLSLGPLLRCAYRHGPEAGRAGRLWMVAHHLVVDSVSWRVLAQDLQAVYECLEQGRPLPPAEAVPFTAWAKAMPGQVQSAAAEQSLWLDMVERAGPALSGPGTASAQAANTHGAALQVHASLDADATARLINAARGRWHCGVEDVLLAVLAETMCQELKTSACLVEVESHGRDALGDGLDVSCTVGWFTARHPLVLPAEAGFERTLRAVRAERDKVPNLGRGWGLLRHLGQDATLRDRLAAAQPLVTFNYIGQTDGTTEGGWLRWVDEPTGDQRGPANLRSHELDLDAHLHEGCLHFSWTYPGDADGLVFTGERVGRLDQNLIFNLRGLAASLADGPRPSLAWRTEDFQLAATLSQPALAQLLARFPALQDIYPLSPLQEGMLYHSQRDQGAGMYLNQLRVAMDGRVDLAAMGAAWQAALDRHEVLRTAFVDAEQVATGPWQVVLGQLGFSLATRDWRDLTDSDAALRLQEWLQADRLDGFDPAEAPLMRVTVLHTPHGDELVWTRHHLLLDGWSTSILLQEVLGHYANVLAARADVGLSPKASAGPVCQYRHHIAWLARRDAQADRRFWTGELADIDEASLLQAAIGLPPQPALRQPVEASALDRAPRHRAVPLDAAVSKGLREAARLSRVTLNTVVQAAWALVLARTTRRQDVVFGVTIAGRPADLPGVESALGLFINTVPLRTRVLPSAVLSQWWNTLQQRNADLREHGHGQLAEIQAVSGVKGGPLFDSVLVFENYPVDRHALQDFCSGLRVREVEAIEIGSMPLTVVAHADEAFGGLAIDLVYQPQCFDAAAMDVLADMLVKALRAFADSADSPAAVIGHICLDERRSASVPGGLGDEKVLPALGSPLPLPPLMADDGLVARFGRQVARAPDARALILGDQVWSYARLDQASSRIAQRLRQAGVREQDPVALCLDRSPTMVAAIIAVLKVGAVYVPVDPASPRDRLAHIVADSGARIVLTQGRSGNALDGLPTLTMLDLDAEVPNQMGEAVASASASPLDGLAYVIYTSGSTGRPKGVGVTHRNVLRLFDATASRFGFVASDVWTLFHSYAFDFSVWEMWGALLHGGTLVIVPQETARDTPAFARLLADQRVTVLNQTPSAFYRLIDEIAPGKGEPPLPHLRWVVFGGEALDFTRLHPWFVRAGEGARLVNMYGITETTVHVTWREIQASALRASSLIGDPLPDLELHVLDDALHPIPPGIVGELYVGGAGLARGYLGRPALTAERFVPHPSPRIAGERLYRSGDLGRRTPDGDIEYMGRADQQVKVRGFRIELGEIQAVVREHPGVRDAAVLARRMPDGGVQLVAYVVAEEALSAEDVRVHAQARLPSYMVPSAVVLVPMLPLTVNGKLDQRALPDPSMKAGQGADGGARPLTAMERQVAAAWAPLLGAGELRHGDNFFALGGHSLLATRAVAQLRAATGLPLDVADLFTHPSITEMAAHLERASARQPSTPGRSVIADLLNELEQAP